MEFLIGRPNLQDSGYTHAYWDELRFSPVEVIDALKRIGNPIRFDSVRLAGRDARVHLLHFARRSLLPFPERTMRNSVFEPCTK